MSRANELSRLHKNISTKHKFEQKEKEKIAKKLLLKNRKQLGRLHAQRGKERMNLVRAMDGGDLGQFLKVQKSLKASREKVSKLRREAKELIRIKNTKILVKGQLEKLRELDKRSLQEKNTLEAKRLEKNLNKFNQLKQKEKPSQKAKELQNTLDKFKQLKQNEQSSKEQKFAHNIGDHAEKQKQKGRGGR